MVLFNSPTQIRCEPNPTIESIAISASSIRQLRLLETAFRSRQSPSKYTSSSLSLSSLKLTSPRPISLFWSPAATVKKDLDLSDNDGGSRRRRPRERGRRREKLLLYPHFYYRAKWGESSSHRPFWDVLLPRIISNRQIVSWISPQRKFVKRAEMAEIELPVVPR